jgi:hypothetical protein
MRHIAYIQAGYPVVSDEQDCVGQNADDSNNTN